MAYVEKSASQGIAPGKRNLLPRLNSKRVVHQLKPFNDKSWEEVRDEADLSNYRNGVSDNFEADGKLYQPPGRDDKASVLEPDLCEKVPGKAYRYEDIPIVKKLIKDFKETKVIERNMNKALCFRMTRMWCVACKHHRYFVNGLCLTCDESISYFKYHCEICCYCRSFVSIHHYDEKTQACHHCYAEKAQYDQIPKTKCRICELLLPAMYFNQEESEKAPITNECHLCIGKGLALGLRKAGIRLAIACDGGRMCVQPGARPDELIRTLGTKYFMPDVEEGDSEIDYIPYIEYKIPSFEFLRGQTVNQTGTRIAAKEEALVDDWQGDITQEYLDRTLYDTTISVFQNTGDDEKMAKQRVLVLEELKAKRLAKQAEEEEADELRKREDAQEAEQKRQEKEAEFDLEKFKKELAELQRKVNERSKAVEALKRQGNPKSSRQESNSPNLRIAVTPESSPQYIEEQETPAKTQNNLQPINLDFNSPDSPEQFQKKQPRTKELLPIKMTFQVQPTQQGLRPLKLNLPTTKTSQTSDGKKVHPTISASGQSTLSETFVKKFRENTHFEKPNNDSTSPRVRRHDSIESGSHLKMKDQLTGLELPKFQFRNGFHLKMKDRRNLPISNLETNFHSKMKDQKAL